MTGPADGSSNHGAKGSLPIRPRPRWPGLIGVLLLAGCSSQPKSHVAARHDAGLSLAPDPATTANRIAVVFADRRLEPAGCRFEWRRNGNLIYDASTDGLDPTFFSKNDEITVTVSAPGSGNAPARNLSASVTVVNTPPKITSATLVPSTETGAAELKVNVESVDPDRDLLTYTYRWFKNNVPIESATGSSLSLSRVSRGDQVAAEVVAHDDVSASAAVRTQPFSVNNRPPVFTSQPIAPTQRDLVFQYHAVANDPDGDPLRYALVSGPTGMNVDPDGTTTWTLPTGEDRQGGFPVSLSATDSKGGVATQDFTIQLTPLPAKK